MIGSLEIGYCDLRLFYLFPETDLWFDHEYFIPLFKSMFKHLILFMFLGFKQKLLFIYSEIFEILVMHNVITKSFPLFNSIWPYISELTQWEQNNLMKMMLLLFLYALYRVIFYTRDLLTALITSIFMSYNNNVMELESYPIFVVDFESNDSNDDEDYYDNSDQSIDEEEEEYEGDGEDNDGDSEDSDGDSEDSDGDSEDSDGDSEDSDGDSEESDEVPIRNYFQDLVYYNRRINPDFYHYYPPFTFYSVSNITPSLNRFPFHIPDVRFYSSDEFYSANELNETDYDEESDSDFSDYLDIANLYYQNEDDRHGDVFGNHNGII